MSTFLTFIGLVALVIVGKFIFDTLSGSAKSDWEQFKKTHPAEAARIERNKNFDLSLKSKSREEDNVKSLNRIANNLGCSPYEAKDYFFDDLRKKKFGISELNELLKMSIQEKYNESKLFDIDPDDTVAALMENWIKEYLQNKEYINRIRTEKQVMDDLIEGNTELKKIALSGDINALKKRVLEDESLVNEFIKQAAYADNPAERLRKDAINIFYQTNDYNKAIGIINKALKINDKETNAFLYELRSECEFELLNYNNALNDINKSIELIEKGNFRDFEFHLSQFLEMRSKIKNKLGDFHGVLADKLSAKKFSKIAKEKSLDDDESDEYLPF